MKGRPPPSLKEKSPTSAGARTPPAVGVLARPRSLEHGSDFGFLENPHQKRKRKEKKKKKSKKKRKKKKKEFTTLPQAGNQAVNRGSLSVRVPPDPLTSLTL